MELSFLLPNPRLLLVRRTGGAGGLSSSLDIFAVRFLSCVFNCCCCYWCCCCFPLQYNNTFYFLNFRYVSFPFDIKTDFPSLFHKRKIDSTTKSVFGIKMENTKRQLGEISFFLMSSNECNSKTSKSRKKKLNKKGNVQLMVR